ncbi:Transposase [Methanosarcina mazei Go1]|uniref:Transposase n=5 Tax=Methanosarcina mazei TaxID=2209 RepID=Q8PYI4_METMA|nr:Transposase [Methanosarcina mazei Go1]
MNLRRFLNLDAEKMLDYYKNQSKVEKGFRFIKDKSFRVSEVYLKKPQRIEALSMVMVLTLMVYPVAEWKLRERLNETGETMLDQVKTNSKAHFEVGFYANERDYRSKTGN